MSDDLISRQAAIDVLEERLQTNGYSNAALVSELNRCIGYVMRLPSARRGRWKKVGDNTYRCSVCGEISCCKGLFCVDCGSRMDGEEE